MIDAFDYSESRPEIVENGFLDFKIEETFACTTVDTMTSILFHDGLMYATFKISCKCIMDYYGGD